MLFRPLSRLPLLVLLALLCACAKPGPDRAATTDGEEIDPYQNLVFLFEEPVVAQGQPERWDTVQYVRFRPAVRGKFKWTSDRELVFSPLTPFAPSTVFDATLQAAALPRGKQQLRLPLNRTRFHTPYLQLNPP